MINKILIVDDTGNRRFEIESKKIHPGKFEFTEAKNSTEAVDRFI